MYTLISFATQWGSKYGGINCFNTDFLSAFGIAYHLSTKVVCIVASATPEEINEARNAHVTLLHLPDNLADNVLTQVHVQASIDAIQTKNITFDPAFTVWLGHDRITGSVANEAAKLAGGRSAVIHHMSYDHYESYAENSATAKTKVEEQKSIFRQADIVLAIGPLLKDAVTDLLGASKEVHMLVPGLAEIEVREAPKTFTAFLSGRLSDDAARIKQVHLGIAAFAQAHHESCERMMPVSLCKQPKMVLRGVDFEPRPSQSTVQPQFDPETDLKRFAENYAHCVINLQALPFIQDRQMLFSDLSSASVVMMPSWHEGFGLAAWEAIAAGVPLILSENSGVFRLLEEEYPGSGTGCVYSINVGGAVDFPFFRPEDLTSVISKLIEIANKPGEARRKAGTLRKIVEKHTWPACAEQASQAFGWSLQKGSLPPVTLEQISSVLSSQTLPTLEPTTPSSPLLIPLKQWKPGGGFADSQLLRAEEALIPFDPARQPELIALNVWLDAQHWPLAVRLITGAGGVGKTRLSLELCKQRLAEGWNAGLLDPLIEPSDVAANWGFIRDTSKPVLIVVDYAETRQAVVLSLIKSILREPAKNVTRLLLLARDGGEWWDNLPSRDSQCEAILCGSATTGPYTLPLLHNKEDDRRNAYQQALRAFARVLDVGAPDVVPELAGDHFGRPLYLQMGALLALHGERPATAEGLTKALLNHERRYWSRMLVHFPVSEPERYAQHLLALTTLAGGFITAKEAHLYWTKTGETALSPSEFTSLFKALEPLYPGKKGLQSVRPDLLGEALVAQALLLPNAIDLLNAVLSNNASHSVRRNALTVLARISGEHPDLNETLVEALVTHFAHCYREFLAVSKETMGLLPTLAEAAFERFEVGSKSQVAGLVWPLLSQQHSSQLAEFSYLVSKFLAEKSKTKVSKKPHNIDYIKAYATDLGNFSVTLAATGRSLEARAKALEVIQLFERLPDSYRQRFQSSYSLALANYAGFLGNEGLYKDALPYDLRALNIRKFLLKNDSEHSKRDYVRSLQGYGIHLVEVGREAEAHDFLNEAVKLSLELSTASPEKHNELYIDSLIFYARYLTEVGEYDAALEQHESSLKILRDCANNQPDRFDKDYAESLLNFAGILADAGRYGEALEHNDKAIAIHERLAQRNPRRFSFLLFSCYSFKNFVKWLLDPSATDVVDNTVAVKDVSSQQSALMDFYTHFLKACRASDQVTRGAAFGHALSSISSFSFVETALKPYWLCTAAWLNTFEPETVENLSWKSEWQSYSANRKGRMPHWMQNVSTQLQIQWPDAREANVQGEGDIL